MSISMLDEKLPILIRETLGDTGTAACVNASPDIIVRKNQFDEEDLTKIFTKTYDQDISLKRDDSEKMYLYVRFKNISDQPLTNFYIHLYRNHLGLSNRPGDWSKFEMHTETGAPAFIECLGAKKIGASPAFVYDKSTAGAHPNCFVAVATREKDPDYSSIHDYLTYIQWVNKQNVAARNISVVSEQSGIYGQTVVADSLDAEQERLMLLDIRMEAGTPSGISYGVRQEKLGIDERQTYIESEKRTHAISCRFLMRPGEQIPFHIWFEACEEDAPLIKCENWFYMVREWGMSAALHPYLINLDTGLAIPDGQDLLPETADCGYLLGCCYLRGGSAE